MYIYECLYSFFCYDYASYKEEFLNYHLQYQIHIA